MGWDGVDGTCGPCGATTSGDTCGDNHCAELVAKYPECADDYEGDIPCQPLQADVDYYEENCEDSSDSDSSDSSDSVPDDAVLCDGFATGDYCDCSSDCQNHPDWCGCAEAMKCCSTNDHCTELVAKYPECADEYEGDIPCQPLQADLDYYEENCEDSSDSSDSSDSAEESIAVPNE